MIRIFGLGCLLSLTLTSGPLFAHAEHDKARFVSIDGKDQGECNNALRPCASIGYAVQRANKGDRVLVASGEYSVRSAEELFYLKSEIVPILAGYNRFDHFKNQSPATNKTWLTGVPAEMAADLRKQGFSIIADGKSAADGAAEDASISELMTQYQSLSQQQAEQPCEGGFAGTFPCDNIDLVGHVPLTAISGLPSAGSDIWGHTDLNTGIEYAIMGFRNGTAVFDLSNPEQPQEIAFISGPSTTWRDIKVYQFFDSEIGEWQAYAYVTMDGSSANGVTILDLNQLPTVRTVEINTTVVNAHNVYISNVDYSYGIALANATPSLQIVGQGIRNSGAFNSFSLSDPTTLNLESNQSSFGGYTHDGASVLIEDQRAVNNCGSVNFRCTVFVDFNENEMNLWNISNPSATQQLSSVTYNDVPPSQQYIHSGWVTEDKRFVLLHDEFDEFRGGLNSTVRIYNIDDLSNPARVGTWTGPTSAIDHNGFVRGNRYYMSNYEKGLTILDITDAANPVEVGNFDTFPVSNGATFNGAWGVYPFLTSGLILVSDINSGLYVLRDNTLEQAQGRMQFETSQVSAQRGASVELAVQRLGATAGAQSVSVGYEIIPGSAQPGEDYEAVSGRLNWVDDDSTAQNISISIPADSNGDQLSEVFFVRLFDPTSGATISAPTYATVNVAGQPRIGTIGFAQTDITVSEGTEQATLVLRRIGGEEQGIEVNYRVESVTAAEDSDYQAVSGSVVWENADSNDKEITIPLIDDDAREDTETFLVVLSSQQDVLNNESTATVTIRDDDSNQTPTVAIQENVQVNINESVTVNSTAVDPDGDALTYQWEQTNGIAVTLNNADQASVSFVAPNASGNLQLRLTVTDPFGASASDSVFVTVVAPPAVTPPSSSGSSGGGSLGFGMLLLLFIARRLR